MQLITIPFSHYNERARWALEHYRLRIEERRYVPMLHFWGVWRVTRGRTGQRDRVSSRYSTPVLVTDDEVIAGSGPILRWAEERHADDASTLYPPRNRVEIERFEADAHDRLGPHTRRIWYWTALQQPAHFQQMIRDNVATRQAALFKVIRPAFFPAVRRSFNIRREGIRRSIAEVRTYLAEVTDALQGKRYLFGDRFTAADLTFAALAAPVLLPVPEYGANVDAIRSTQESEELTQECRETPAGQHALRMFREHRHP